MSTINVSNLTFYYEGIFDNIFEEVSFCIDTDWKLGLIGRNGKGKTTFLNLLLGKYEYQGSIQANTAFDYFPYQISEAQMQECMADFLEDWKPDCELWRVIMELEKMNMSAEVLYRSFNTLSHGERTRVMLAILFSRENYFLLIDEPTNHLDQISREIVKEYLQQKKGFLLVSHDRDLLDACVDHVLVMNRVSIEVQKGNFSSWQENKERMDSFHMSENEKHLKEIGKLKQAAERTRNWAEKSERAKIGFDPIKEHDRCTSTRSYIGAKTKKMQSRVKQTEGRIKREMEEKEGLLHDMESPVELKLMPLQHHKDVLIRADQYGLSYKDTFSGVEHKVLENFAFELHQGERIALKGKNGCGKSSFIKAVLQSAGVIEKEMGNAGNKVQISDKMQTSDKVQTDDKMQTSCIVQTGTLQTASGLVISYINQDTSALSGNLTDFCQRRQLDESLLKAILRQLDFDRVQFVKKMEDYSEGQKKKVLIAASLLKQAHLYIWDEPLNYIDVFSRMQIEDLILRYQPTMLFVEHDIRFQEKVATRVYEL